MSSRWDVGKQEHHFAITSIKFLQCNSFSTTTTIPSRPSQYYCFCSIISFLLANSLKQGSEFTDVTKKNLIDHICDAAIIITNSFPWSLLKRATDKLLKWSPNIEVGVLAPTHWIFTIECLNFRPTLYITLGICQTQDLANTRHKKGYKFSWNYKITSKVQTLL